MNHRRQFPTVRTVSGGFLKKYSDKNYLFCTFILIWQQIRRDNVIINNVIPPTFVVQGDYTHKNVKYIAKLLTMSYTDFTFIENCFCYYK